MQFFCKVATTAVFLLGGSIAWAAPETFAIDSNHTYPMFSVGHMSVSLQRGRFNKTSGKIVLDREAKAGSIDVTIETKSLDMGFEKWDQHMKSEDFFNVEKFPFITFKSKKLIFEGDKLVGVDGDFTLLGVTRPMRLKVFNFVCTQHPMFKKLYCGAEVSAEIKRSDYGMKNGIPMVDDKVHLVSAVEAVKED